MNALVYICIHMHIYARISVSISLCVCHVGSRCSIKTPQHVSLYVFLYIYVCTHMYENTHTSICIHLHFRTCVLGGNRVHFVMYISLQAYLYTHIFI